MLQHSVHAERRILTASNLFTQDQCERLQKLIRSKLLSKLGLPRTFPTEILYGDEYHGGLGVRELFGEQGMYQVQTLVKHIRAGSLLGTQMEIAIHCYQLQAGISAPVLEMTAELPYLEYPWFDRIREYLW